MSDNTTQSSLSRLLRYLKRWRSKVIFASIYSALNKIFDIAPEVLIGVAVDLVVKKNQSFVASLGFESINELIDEYRRITNQVENTESEDESEAA